MVASVQNPRKLVPVLHAIGRRHITYGARDHRYDVVIDALRIFKEVLGDFFRWTTTRLGKKPSASW
jgi:hypothetical protein